MKITNAVHQICFVMYQSFWPAVWWDVFLITKLIFYYIDMNVFLKSRHCKQMLRIACPELCLQLHSLFMLYMFMLWYMWTSSTSSIFWWTFQSMNSAEENYPGKLLASTSFVWNVFFGSSAIVLSFSHVLNWVLNPDLDIVWLYGLVLSCLSELLNHWTLILHHSCVRPYLVCYEHTGLISLNFTASAWMGTRSGKDSFHSSLVLMDTHLI